jgi:predicted nucleic-acid-binding protein
VNITADTNLLVRVVIEDDPIQTEAAEKALETADRVVLTIPALCELVWVLSRLYKVNPAGSAFAIRKLMGGDNVAVDEDAVNAGLAMLDAGGDFADGVIAYQGRVMGGDLFLSFDRKAVATLTSRAIPARLLA